MSNIPEVILLDSDDDEPLPKSSTMFGTHNGERNSRCRDFYPEPFQCDEMELPDIDSDNSVAEIASWKPSSSSLVSAKTSKPQTHFSSAAYFQDLKNTDSSDLSDIESKPVIKVKKKKKSILNTSKGVHDTSTDEIDSDDCSPVKNIKTSYSSQGKVVGSSDDQKPCCSKSLLPNLSSFRVRDVPNSSTDTWQSFDQLFVKTDAAKKTTEAKRRKEAEAEKRKADREQKKIAKDLKNAELQREKALKKSENEIRKNSKPGEAHKFITIVLTQNVLEKYDTLIPLLISSDVNYQINYSSVLANSFTFKRETIHQAMGDDLQLHKVSNFIEEDQLMILIDSNEAIPMIYAYIRKNSDNVELDDMDIITWVDSIKSEYSSKKVTLIFIGMDSYYKKIKKNTQQEFRDRVLNGGYQDVNPKRKRVRKGQNQLPEVTKLEVESCLIDMQIRTEVNYRMVKNVNELSVLLIQYAKAIADAPFKRQKMTDSGFDWYALADSGSVRVDKEGNGLRALWILQLQCFNNVGVDTATAIAEKYPSPQALTKAFIRCPTVEDGLALLRDIQVKVGIGPLAKYRKIGPELSKRMYRFFTSNDGDKFLSSTADTM